jgi:hypothetical protein
MSDYLVVRPPVTNLATLAVLVPMSETRAALNVTLNFSVSVNHF